jgi:hypothetical protein
VSSLATTSSSATSTSSSSSTSSSCLSRFQLSHEVSNLDLRRTTININNKIITLRLWSLVTNKIIAAEKKRSFLSPLQSFIEHLACTDLGGGRTHRVPMRRGDQRLIRAAGDRVAFGVTAAAFLFLLYSTTLASPFITSVGFLSCWLLDGTKGGELLWPRSMCPCPLPCRQP